MDPKAASRSVPLTWNTDILVDASRRFDRSRFARDAVGYLLVFGGIVAATAVTRFTWPLFSRTPLIVLFGATFAAALWSNETGALLSIITAAFAAGFAMPDGAPRVDELSLVLFVSGSLVIGRVIAGHNHAVTAMRASEARFRAAWDNSAFGAALLNRRGLVERINPALERALGYPSAAWAGVSFGYFSHPDDQADERTRFAAFIDDGEEWYHREQRYRRADGAIMWCRVTMSATHDGDGGGRTGALMVLEDVTRRRRAEDDLRAWEARYRRLFEQVPVGLFQCGLDGRILSANAAFLALLRYESTGAVRGAGIADFVAERDARSSIQDALAAGGRVHERHAVLQQKDGGRVAVILDVRPVHTADGVVEYLDGTAREA